MITLESGIQIEERGISIITQMPGRGFQHLSAQLDEDEEGFFITFAQDGVVGAEDIRDLGLWGFVDEEPVKFPVLVVKEEMLRAVKNGRSQEIEEAMVD